MRVLKKNTTHPKKKHHAKLSVFSLVMINVIAIDSLRSLPITAEYGFALVFFYLIAALTFFIPVALVTAELATGWPELGGIYVWVREAFGGSIGFLTIWLQWIYNVVWYPTILAFIAATIAPLINPDLAASKIYMLSMILGMFWVTTFLNCLGMRTSSAISTLGAIVGTLLPMGLIIGLGLLWLLGGYESAITFSWKSFFPGGHDLHNIAFFSTVLFSLIGLEMSAVHAEDVANPKRDYPRALLYSALIILVTLVLSSLAIAVVIPQHKLSLVSGLVDAFIIFFQKYQMEWMIPVIILTIALGGLCCVSTWVIGPTRGLLAAMRDGVSRSKFSRTNRKDAPTNILLLQACIVTVLCLLFFLLPTVNAFYWVLSALTAQLALIVNILMFAAAIRLRYSHPFTHRAYKIPGGKFATWGVASTGIAACLFGIGVGFLPPTEIDTGKIIIYESILVIGMIIFCLPPFFMYLKRRNGLQTHAVNELSPPS